MDIKKFLQDPEIQDLLEAENLDAIYENIDPMYVNNLTKFFLANNINPLEYINEVYPNMYSELNITNIKLPNNIKSISDDAFYFCQNLTSVTIHDGVKSIGRFAFGDCVKLSSITIPDSVTSIGEEAFYGCDNLTSITIPNNVTNIGNKAFAYCTKLTIKCKENSVAHKYAVENNLKFELI